MKKRIAFIGASGTGKSTLAAVIAERFSLSLNPVGSRSVAREMGFENPYDVDRAGRRNEFQRRLFDAKREWEAKHDEFVVDRTVFDNLAYASLHGGAAVLSKEEVDAYVAAMQRYTHIFWLPLPSFQALDGDPMRVFAVGYHEVYDAMVFGFLSLWGIPYRTLSCSKLDERIHFVTQELHYSDHIE